MSPGPLLRDSPGCYYPEECTGPGSSRLRGSAAFAVTHQNINSILCFLSCRREAVRASAGGRWPTSLRYQPSVGGVHFSPLIKMEGQRQRCRWGLLSTHLEVQTYTSKHNKRNIWAAFPVSRTIRAPVIGTMTRTRRLRLQGFYFHYW